MKKLFLSMSLALCFVGCNRTETEVPTEKEIPAKPEPSVYDESFDAGLDAVYEQALSIATHQKLVYKVDQLAYRDNQNNNFGVYAYDPVKGLGSMPDSINARLFNKTASTFLGNARLSAVQSVPLPATVASVKDLVQNSAYPYTAQQKTMLTTVIDNIFSYSDSELLEKSLWALNGFALSIHLASMPDFQKKELKNYHAMMVTICKYLRDGGIDEIYNGILETMPTTRNARTTSCKINTRGVLIAAMYDGVKGAITGALTGAAGGTVTIPILGTVSGALGGAIFGGAVGFTTGAVHAVAQQLIETCTRNIKNENASCAEVLNNYLNGSSTTKSYLLQNFRYCFKIDDGDLVLTPTQTYAESVILLQYQAVTIFNY